MDLALTINGWIDEEVIFAQQLGARHVFARVDNHPGGSPGNDAQSLAHLANRIEKAGLILAGLRTGVLSNGRGDEENLAWVARLIHEAGEAKIDLLSLAAALFTARQSSVASVMAKIHPLAEMAERAGVRLAIPARILVREPVRGSPTNLANVLHSLPPSAGLDGSTDQPLDRLSKAAEGSDPRRLIRDRLFLVSWENDGRAAHKNNGDGYDGLLSVCWRLRQAGYNGLIRLGQPSRWKGDTIDRHHARAYTTGYFRAVLQAFQRAETLR
jgi:hypothetical protein